MVAVFRVFLMCILIVCFFPIRDGAIDLFSQDLSVKLTDINQNIFPGNITDFKTLDGGVPVNGYSQLAGTLSLSGISVWKRGNGFGFRGRREDPGQLDIALTSGWLRDGSTSQMIMTLGSNTDQYGADVTAECITQRDVSPRSNHSITIKSAEFPGILKDGNGLPYLEANGVGNIFFHNASRSLGHPPLGTESIAIVTVTVGDFGEGGNLKGATSIGISPALIFGSSYDGGIGFFEFSISESLDKSKEVSWKMPAMLKRGGNVLQGQIFVTNRSAHAVRLPSFKIRVDFENRGTPDFQKIRSTPVNKSGNKLECDITPDVDRVLFRSSIMSGKKLEINSISFTEKAG